MLQLCVLIAASDARGGEAPAASALKRGLLGGAAYGLTAAAVSHPFDTIKTQLQTGTLQRGSLFSLYRGVGPATVASILFRTVPFIGYSWTQSQLRVCQLLQDQPLLAAFLGGAVGGVMRGCLETPAEFIKTRLQVRSGWAASMLLQGLWSTCLRNACVIGVFWTAFELSAAARSRLPPTAASFVGGGACSVVAWAAIYPLDTAKSVIQASTGPRTPTVPQALALVFRKHGLLGWYAGLGAGLARAFLANGAGMAAYGWVQHRLDAERTCR